jgi:hypothetical protein
MASFGCRSNSENGTETLLAMTSTLPLKSTGHVLDDRSAALLMC